MPAVGSEVVEIMKMLESHQQNWEEDPELKGRLLCSASSGLPHLGESPAAG